MISGIDERSEKRARELVEKYGGCPTVEVKLETLAEAIKRGRPLPTLPTLSEPGFTGFKDSQDFHTTTQKEVSP